jgi:carbamate kinase
MDGPGDRNLVGVECVIDRDHAREVLARPMEADLFVMATEVDAVDLDWGAAVAPV